MTLVTVLFFVFSLLLVTTAALAVFRPRPIECALWLLLNFFLTSGIYVLLGAHFVAIIQLLVYAGAIVVLFVFVILLLNVDPREGTHIAGIPRASLILFLGTLAAVVLCLHIATPELLEGLPALEEGSKHGSVEAFSRTFLDKYVWGFEAAGILLLLALLGVGLLAYRKPRSGLSNLAKGGKQ